MAGLRIAAAQSATVSGGIAANVSHHGIFVDAAAEAGVSLLVFPELSLSGYDLPGLAGAALCVDDARLDPLREQARRHGMTIVAGAPLANRNGLPFIGALALQPDGSSVTYRKHFLHPGEDIYAAPGSAISQLIDVRGVPVALAICADTTHQAHPHAAVLAGATLYVAGSVITPGGYAKDAVQLAGHARQFSVGVLMANHAFATGGYTCAGRSAAWMPDGQLLVAADGQGELLVMADEDSGAVLPVATAISL
ncbi:MAG TPA: carbon-nitrogen hydrolase family protein [Telluria sp.]|jgi:predicted amidohydrolase